MRSLLRRLAALALSLLVTGCGFQLRGAAPVSAALQPLAVVCGNAVPEPLCQAVRDQLVLGGTELGSADTAAYRLELQSFSRQRRTSAITVQAATAEYTLRQSTTLTLVSSDGVPLIADTTLSSSESYRYDETNVLAKRREEQDIEERLHERLAQQVIFRLAPLTEARINSLRESAATRDDQEPSGKQP